MASVERHTMWASARTAVGVVTELVNVHATLGRRIIALDVVCDVGVR